MFISVSVMGNAREAVYAARRVWPEWVQKCVFQFVPVSASECMVVLKDADPEGLRRLAEYFGLRP